MKKIAIIGLIILGVKDINAQSKLEIYVNPLIHKLGNLNDQYTAIETPYMNVDYEKKNSFEFGLQYHYGFKNKFGLSAGLGWRKDYLGVEIDFLEGYPPSFISQKWDLAYNANIGMVNLNLLGSYDFNDRFRLNFGINVYRQYVMNSTFTENYGFGTSAGSTYYPATGVTVPNEEYSFNLISKFSRPRPFKIVPEVSLETRIYKGLKLTTGFRFKFWNNEGNEQYRVKIQGHMGEENYGTYTTVHSSAINTRDLSCYIGLKYNFDLSKKNRETN